MRANYEQRKLLLIMKIEVRTIMLPVNMKIETCF
jgi:hypothetical protein